MLLIMMTVAFTIPPAAKMLAIIGSVYGLLQGAKKIPALTKYLTGWVAITINIVLTACGLLIAIPADQLYTTNTLLLLLTTVMGAAGIHGTVQSLSAPTVLAVTPPSTVAKETPATLVPDDPAAIPVKPPETKQKGL